MLSIVVVEEDPLMRRLLEEWLQATGYEVRAFSSAGDVAGPAPDLVIVDLYMPRQGGREKLADLQARWPGTPLIAMSAQFHEARSAPSAVARDLGAKRLIAKPCARETLLSAVRDATLSASAP
jgi:CheY-like chemotaxis protein